MPSNPIFEFSIEVGGVKIPEYNFEGNVFVESNLFTPFSYKLEMQEVCSGNAAKSTQGWPSTPYTIVIHHCVTSDLPQAYFRVIVDGIKARAVNLSRGQSRTVTGFKAGTGIREFLFSLPQISSTERLSEERAANIGKIQVECWRAELKRTVRKTRVKQLNYTQAGKADASLVTHGAYCMSTTRVGRLVKEEKAIKVVNHWTRKALVGTLVVQYHMAETLREKGIEMKSIAFPPVMGCTSKVEDKIEIKSDKFEDLNTTSSALGDELIKSDLSSYSTGSVLPDCIESQKVPESSENGLTAEAITGMKMDGSETEPLFSADELAVTVHSEGAYNANKLVTTEPSQFIVISD